MHTSPRSYKKLQPKDRMTIASLKQQNYGIRQIAIMMQRSPDSVTNTQSSNCHDNDVAESFSMSMKLERIKKKIRASRNEA